MMFEYHENASYIDCKGKNAEYCDKCGYKNMEENQTIAINKAELENVLNILLDIAEECYPKYDSCDNIAVCNDFYKENLN